MKKTVNFCSSQGHAHKICSQVPFLPNKGAIVEETNSKYWRECREQRNQLQLTTETRHHAVHMKVYLTHKKSHAQSMM